MLQGSYLYHWMNFRVDSLQEHLLSHSGDHNNDSVQLIHIGGVAFFLLFLHFLLLETEYLGIRNTGRQLLLMNICVYTVPGTFAHCYCYTALRTNIHDIDYV